jgi:hypothetical protein
MAITSGDTYIASSKQIIPYGKTASVTTVASTLRYTVFAMVGTPSAGTIVGTANPGAVPVDTDAGYPQINTFGASATGYLTRVQYNSSVACRLELWDKLYAIAIDPKVAAVTPATGILSPPSYSGRIPGSNYSGLRLFYEVSASFTGGTAATITVTYTNQSGTTGKTTAATTFGATTGNTIYRWVELPLAAGDSGIQKIETVTIAGTVPTVGTINVIVARPLWSNRVNLANYGGLDGLDRTGMPIVYDTSALTMTCVTDSTSSGVPDLNIEIANG